ncbi:MAG: glycosyltransferase family 4 protein [Flavobacteriales bacterium]
MHDFPRIGFLTATDPYDKRSWSGIHSVMLEELKKRFSHVEVLGPLDGGLPLKLGKIRNRLTRLFTGKAFDYSHSERLSKHYAKLIAEKIRDKKIDVLIAPTGSSLVAHLKLSIPYVLISDTTFANMVDYYPAYTSLSTSSLIQSKEIEDRAIQNALFCAYPGQWAATSAIRDHGAQSEKVFRIPFGANLRNVPERKQALTIRDNSVLRLLFLGVDWQRKGGPLVLETFRLLQARNIPVQLEIIGCDPGISDEGITVVHFVNKNDADGEKRIIDALLRSHFLFLPSVAECYGIVFCEAAACGTPSVARKTGGIADALVEGKSGILFPAEATATAYADYFVAHFLQIENHEKWMVSSRDVYEQTHNWERWGDEMEKMILFFLPV